MQEDAQESYKMFWDICSCSWILLLSRPKLLGWWKGCCVPHIMCFIVVAMYYIILLNIGICKYQMGSVLPQQPISCFWYVPMFHPPGMSLDVMKSLSYLCLDSLENHIYCVYWPSTIWKVGLTRKVFHKFLLVISMSQNTEMCFLLFLTCIASSLALSSAFFIVSQNCLTIRLHSHL